MKISSFAFPLMSLAVCAIASPAKAHVVLGQKTAEAGSAYRAALQVGHGCSGSPTTAITVQLPEGFSGAKPVAKDGWTLATQAVKPGSAELAQVSWTASGKQAALADGQKGEFAIDGKLGNAVGPLWFKVLQTCEAGSTDWREVPAAGASAKGLKSPAAMLDVTAPGQPTVAGAWIRATVPGQSGSGAFMTLTAKTTSRLVAVSTPAAGVAEVHEMKMDGDIMRMRAVAGGVELPAGKPVELKSGGFHVMLMDLKQPLVNGSTVPLTLTLRDAKGAESKVELQVPVSLTAPDGKADPMAGMDHSAHQTK